VRKWVTVRVLQLHPDGSRTVRLSDHHNERDGRRSRLTVTVNQMGAVLFDRLCRDHGMTADQFPVGVPVRVHEPA
jgi:hypothetical protein